MPNITTTPIEVEAEVKQYTLVGDDIYVKRYENNNIPDWYRNMIDNILNGNSTITNITDAYNYLNSLQQGYNLSITQLQEGQLVIDTRLESLKSSNDVALAGIADLWITKIDGASAQAIADTTIGAFFTEGHTISGAWFNERVSTYASAIQSNASNITVLSAVLENTAVRIDTIDEVLVTLDGWSANASKLITAPDGAITGWSFGDGSNMQSFFKIYAESFSISDGTTGYTPFSIVGSDIQFNGTVSINKTQGSIFIGSYNSAPSTVSVVIGGVTYTLKDGDTYKNTTNNVVYYKSGTSWVSTQGIAGVIGADGQGQVKGICFLRASSTPATPTGGSYSSPTATGWSDGVPAGTLPLYMTTRIFTSDGLTPQQSVWTTPQLTSALGQGTKVQFSVDGSTSWHDTPAISDEYMRTGTSTDGGATWTYAGAVKIKGEAGVDGTDGATGVNGVRGAISAFATYTTVTPTASELAATINIIANPDGCIVGDNVMYTVSGVSGGTKMAYCTGAGNPGTWVNNVALYVNGNAIINGTITAGQIAAGAITSDHIAANTITASDIAANTITATQISSSYVYAGTIVADNITTGTLNVDRIVSGSLTSTVVQSFNLHVTGEVLLASISTVAGVVTTVVAEVLNIDSTYWSLKRNGVLINNFAMPYIDTTGSAATYSIYSFPEGINNTFTGRLIGITYKK